MTDILEICGYNENANPEEEFKKDYEEFIRLIEEVKDDD